MYIERYVSGESEFEMAIKHITVDFPLLFLEPHNHLSTHHLALAHALDAAKLVRQPGDKTLPSTEGCGLDQDLPSSLRSEDETAAWIRSMDGEGAV